MLSLLHVLEKLWRGYQIDKLRRELRVWKCSLFCPPCSLLWLNIIPFLESGTD